MKLSEFAKECRDTWKEDRNGVPVVGLEHLEPGEVKLSVWDVDSENTFTKRFNKGQVLLGRRRVYLRKAVVAPFDGICSGDITVIEAIPGKILPELLPFVIQNDAFFDYAEQGSAGSLSPRVKWEHLKDFEVNLPSIEEQKVLAEKLWAAYRLKESYKKLLAATDEMVKSRFIEMFGNPIELQNDENLPTLREYVNVISGFPFDSAKFNTDAKGTPLIRIRDIQNGYTNTYTTESFDEQFLIHNGELLIGMDGNFEISRWSSSDAALNQRVCALKPIKTEMDAFYEYLVRPVIKHIEKNTNATTVKHLSTKQISSIRVPQVYDKEKGEFHKFVVQKDKSGFELRKSIENIDSVIKSLINN